MNVTIHDSIQIKLMEVSSLLRKAQCEGEYFDYSMDCFNDSWAREISQAMDNLVEKIEYYVDN